MDFRSDTFQRAHQELSTMQNLDKNTVMSYLQNNINQTGQTHSAF